MIKLPAFSNGSYRDLIGKLRPAVLGIYLFVSVLSPTQGYFTRCMEHMVYLGVKVFVEGVNLRKPKTKGSQDTDELDWDADFEEGLDEEEDGDLPDGQEVDDPIDFQPGDVLGKLLALINQVCCRELGWLTGSTLKYLSDLLISTGEDILPDNLSGGRISTSRAHQMGANTMGIHV